MLTMQISTAELPLVPVIAGYHRWNSALCELNVLWESQAVARPKSRYWKFPDGSGRNNLIDSSVTTKGNF